MSTLSESQLVQAPLLADERRSWRKFRTAAIILPAMGVFLLHGFLIKLLVRDRVKRQRLLVKNVSDYSRFGLRHMRIDVKTSGKVAPNENYLIVSNHLSYLDILVIASVMPSVFVTSIDMGEVFFLGTMAEIGGSLFIERRHRERVEHDLRQITQRLQDGFHVLLFPEGTSSNGDAVLPFKKSLLMSAPAAGKKILPVTLRYAEIDGDRFSPHNRDGVCWYGRMSFGPHLLGLLAKRSVKAELVFHLPITPREGDTRDTLAKWSHRLVSGAFKTES